MTLRSLLGMILHCSLGRIQFPSRKEHNEPGHLDFGWISISRQISKPIGFVPTNKLAIRSPIRLQEPRLQRMQGARLGILRVCSYQLGETGQFFHPPPRRSLIGSATACENKKEFQRCVQPGCLRATEQVHLYRLGSQRVLGWRLG